MLMEQFGLTKITFDSFIEGIKLSEVKLVLLTRLWGEGDDFPKKWVKSSDLLALTNQKYFDRRLRELRDEQGLDIESKQINGEHHWCLNSTIISQTNDRTYLTANQKTGLFERAEFKCAVCRGKVLPGIRGLQADHKVPLIKGGTNDTSNWQPLCNESNVAKRGVCKGCDLECAQCSWAFPEVLGFNYVIKVPSQLFEQLESANLNQKQIEKFLIEQLKSLIDQTK
jgi:hypothetical protein